MKSIFVVPTHSEPEFPETLDNPEKLKMSRLSGVSRFRSRLAKLDTDFHFYRLKRPLIHSYIFNPLNSH